MAISRTDPGATTVYVDVDGNVITDDEARMRVTGCRSTTWTIASRAMKWESA